ncbi:hypothetical protein FAZ69_04465 [Trinickia terrae]|uniref:Uncharacterized protein n=1 Tax=Trinickia terrae TaxID=2571161 RepID=A0A4U1IDI6_9BURK|nr:hypothetical protein [Trinickia terrae]TKC91701.1 hypothetical protein FAZ69_04465 [Trinickia terrae]
MNANFFDDGFPPLTAEQIRDLAVAVREDFGCSLSRATFTDMLLNLLENVPGCESNEVPLSLIDSAWAEYARRDREA